MKMLSARFPVVLILAATAALLFAPAVLGQRQTGADESVAAVSSVRGMLSENRLITSQKLGYDLQYTVYTPPGYDEAERLPVLYLTDGQWYAEQGRYPEVLDGLIADGSLPPTLAVFIDNRDPSNLQNNRRNRQFFCNPAYEQFVADELVPMIDATYRTEARREGRAIMGLSFGGLQAACMALHEADTFAQVGLQSPATHPVPRLHGYFQEMDVVDVRVFLSSGSHRDNEAKTRRLRDILESRAIDLEYVEVPFGHDWDNWGPLLDDAVVYFFGSR